DRFLEHSRVYYFESSKALYLSSADWMPRNFFSRLELAFPILDARIHKFIREIVLSSYLYDNVKSRELNAKGHWQRRTHAANHGTIPLQELPFVEENQLRAQFYFEQLAGKGYKQTSLTVPDSAKWPTIFSDKR